MRNFAHVLGAASRRKTILAALVGVVVLAVVASVVGYAALSRTVRVTVDGEPREITVLGDTVGSALDAAGVEVGARDQVVPAVGEDIHEGSHIVVNYARPLELTVDGETQTHWVTAMSVDAALSQLGQTFDNAKLSTSRSEPISRGGLDIEVVTSKEITLELAGKKPVTKWFRQLTVGGVLDSLGVKVDGHDTVKPARDTEIEGGERIVFTDIQVKEEKVSGEEIDFETVEESDDSMYEGETEVEREGVVGLRDVVYSVRVVNGKEVERKILDSTVTREPVDEVVRVGTKEPEPEPTSSAPPVAGGSVWDALAQCESGGNWHINTGNGYYGGLQFSLSTWHAVGGTGYPHEHSREEQIHRGQILQSSAGWGQWPHCAAQLGLI